MPLYIFQNPKTEEVIEVLQSMNEEHKYLNNDGLEYTRLYTIPNCSIDSRIDPYSSKDFAEKILQVYKIKSDVIKKRVLKQNTIAKQYDFDVRAKKYSEWLDKLYLKS